MRDHVEVLVGHLPQHAIAQQPGVGHHHVEAAELGHRAGDQRLGRGRVADRAHLGDRAAPVGGDGRDGLLRRVAVEVVDHHGGARTRQRDRVRTAKAAPAAGDHRDPVVQPQRAHA